MPEEPPVEETLRKYGSTLIRLAMSKEQIALIRVVGMEAAKFPELGKRFYELGPKRGEKTLAAYFHESGGEEAAIEHWPAAIPAGTISWKARPVAREAGLPQQTSRIVRLAEKLLRRGTN